MNHAKRLLNGEERLAIIGMGYMGYSNMIKYLKNGVRCVVTDFNTRRLSDLKSNRYPNKNRFLYWKEFAELKYVAAEDRCEVVPPEKIIQDDVSVYIICVPFDYRSAKSPTDLEKTIGLFRSLNKKKGHKPVIIFESMLKPYTMKKSIIPAFKGMGLKPGKDFILSYAPRKDWFLEEMEHDGACRVVASMGAGGGEELGAILGMIHENVVHSDHITCVEVAQCLENAMVQTGNALINQMIFAYPDIDIRESIRLMDGQNSRIQAGINSAFELLLSSQFLIDSATNPNYLTILNDSLSANYSIQQAVVELLNRMEIKTVAVLGLLPHENKAEYDSAPSLLLPNLLALEKMEVLVHDPFLSNKKARKLTGCKSLPFPEGLADVECIILLTSHTCYSMFGKTDLVKLFRSCRLILDNTGLWKRFNIEERKGLTYRVIGERLSLQ
jgi:UDP-N-acetyl-D-galactosamine dehydrogenase